MCDTTHSTSRVLAIVVFTLNPKFLKWFSLMKTNSWVHLFAKQTISFNRIINSHVSLKQYMHQGQQVNQWGTKLIVEGLKTDNTHIMFSGHGYLEVLSHTRKIWTREECLRCGCGHLLFLWEHYYNDVTVMHNSWYTVEVILCNESKHTFIS